MATATKVTTGKPAAKRAPTGGRKAATKAATTTDVAAIRKASALLKQASDATRLQALLVLRGGERNVAELCGDVGSISQPAVSHHLSLLRAARLIEPRRSGKNSYYTLTPSGRVLADVVAGMVGGGD